MKKAHPCLAGLTALALAVAVVPVPVAATAAEEPPARNPDSVYASTAIGAVIDANGGRAPASGLELTAALAKLGDFVHLPVPFSAVALGSGLPRPRVVIAMRPSSHPAQVDGVGWGYGRAVPFTPPPEPLNRTARNRTQLEGRLFLAANTEPSQYVNVVKSVEFISWNGRKQRFDFGVIEGMNTAKPELKMLDGTRCFSCHKNRGPILGVAPWSNTIHGGVVRDALEENVPLGPARSRAFNDGLDLFTSHVVEVDAAVRIGGNLFRDRAVFRHLAATAEGRRALVLLFGAVLAPGDLDQHDKRIKKELDRLAPASFVGDAQAVRQVAISGALRDFRPPASAVRNSIGWGFDSPRVPGTPALPSAHVPSNPKAFVPFTAKALQRPSDAVSAVLLARTMGLSEDDRAFLATALDEATSRFGDPSVTQAKLATAVFIGPSFADVLKTGVLPERDDFKDRFVAGLVAELRTRNRAEWFWRPRDTYASAPKFDPSAKPEKELVALPSHACLSCHEVRTFGNPAVFTPIPALAFDPLDATARAEWLKTADRKKRTEVLGRMVKRLGTDRDMPPADSVEAEMYSVKDPAALNVVKDWLDAELKKLK